MHTPSVYLAALVAFSLPVPSYSQVIDATLKPIKPSWGYIGSSIETTKGATHTFSWFISTVGLMACYSTSSVAGGAPPPTTGSFLCNKNTSLTFTENTEVNIQVVPRIKAEEPLAVAQSFLVMVSPPAETGKRRITFCNAIAAGVSNNNPEIKCGSHDTLSP